MTRLLIAAALCACIGEVAGVVFTRQAVAAYQAPAVAHECPAPRQVLLVRCQTRFEVTGQTVSCKREARIDGCVQ